MLLDQIFDAIENLCLTIILIAGPVLGVVWFCAWRHERLPRQYRATRRRLGYDT
jgi:heme/copper-type cytochrome/quinol oxidase subunit 2